MNGVQKQAINKHTRRSSAAQSHDVQSTYPRCSKMPACKPHIRATARVIALTSSRSHTRAARNRFLNFPEATVCVAGPNRGAGGIRERFSGFTLKREGHLASASAVADVRAIPNRPFTSGSLTTASAPLSSCVDRPCSRTRWPTPACCVPAIMRLLQHRI